MYPPTHPFADHNYAKAAGAVNPQVPLDESNEILRLLEENRQVLDRAYAAKDRLQSRLRAVTTPSVPTPAAGPVSPPDYPPPSCDLANSIRDQILFVRNIAAELEDLHDRIRL